MRQVKLENKSYPHFKCGRCTKMIIKKPRIRWKGLITKEIVYICKDCAYKENYGTKKRAKARRERWLGDE